MSKESKTYEKSPRKVYIRTFGCQMNNRDTELICGLLMKEGYAKTDSLEGADVALFNTCSVRKHAEERVYGKVGTLKHWKKKNPSAILGVIGCMAQSRKAEIFKRLPHVDFISGPSDIYKIPELIRQIELGENHVFALNSRQRPDIQQPAFRENPISAYVSISEGCDNFCSYCIVPYVRGREQSRHKALILDEVKQLADSGYKEIILLGQNVNAYKDDRGDENGFVKLLEDVNKVKGLERIRFMTSHPKDATDDLFKAMRDLDKVCEHLHLPLQSGSDKILKRMKRGYTREKYSKVAENFRKILPKSSLTTDIIIGFPDEEKEDFKHTCDMMKTTQFDSAFIFKYSPRPPAKSSEYEDNVSEETKKERNQFSLRLQEEIARKRNKALIGSDIEVLVESKNKNNSGKSLCGRTRTNKIVMFDSTSDLLKKLIYVKIKRVTNYTLIGDISDYEK